MFFARAVRFLNAALMPRTFLAVCMHLGMIQMDAKMPIKAIGWGRVSHMRHCMHACGNRFAVICYPYRPAIPREALKALYNGCIVFGYRFAVRMVPAAEALSAEAFARAHVRNGKACALMQPFVAAFEPIQQHNRAFEPIEIGIRFFKLI